MPNEKHNTMVYLGKKITRFAEDHTTVVSLALEHWIFGISWFMSHAGGHEIIDVMEFCFHSTEEDQSNRPKKVGTFQISILFVGDNVF